MNGPLQAQVYVPAEGRKAFHSILQHLFSLKYNDTYNND